MAKILLIDDDDAFCDLLLEGLHSHAHEVLRFACAEPGVELLTDPAAAGVDVVLLDQQMPGLTGIEFLEQLRDRGILTPVILVTGHFTPSVKIPGYKLGVRAYFTKPIEFTTRAWEHLLGLIRQAVATSRTPPGQRSAENETPVPVEPSKILLGNSEPMEQVWQRLGTAARDARPVLITGETGTGKDLIAEALHYHSKRGNKPFFKRRCEATLAFEEDLFGNDADSVPQQSRPGLLERAEGGTVLLDEIGATTPTIQGKLLELIGKKTIRRCGRGTQRPTDAWVIATSQEDLKAPPAPNTFEPSLYYQFTHIPLPPLRERGRDIELLANHFLEQLLVATHTPKRTFHPSTLERLRCYSWPGNLWELKEVVRLALLESCASQILPQDLPTHSFAVGWQQEVAARFRQTVSVALTSDRTDLYTTLPTLLERELVLGTWAETKPNLHEAARRLGVSPEQVRKQLQELGHETDLDGSSPAEPNSPRSDPKLGSKAKRAYRRARALEIIPECPPDWTTEDIAKAVGCSKATLYRDPILKRLLDTRKGDPTLRRIGYRNRQGTPDGVVE